MIGGGLLAALTAALVTFVFAGTAFADTIQFTGQGTNNDGTCETFQQDSGVPAGKQVWQFNLTSTNSGATMSATFSDGTTVTNKAEDDHNGNTSMWFITTDLGAMVTSASATFTPTQGNPQFVVSHCSTNGPPPTTAPPTTTTPTTEPSTTTPSTTAPGGPEVGGITAERPQAAVAVVAQPGFTG